MFTTPKRRYRGSFDKKVVIPVIWVMAIITLFALYMAGCSAMDTYLSKLKGELTGNDYIITEYDNFGNKTLTVKGNKVALNAEMSDGEIVNSYIDITIDGSEWNHVGGTLIFAQNGVDMITDFQLDHINTKVSNSTGFMPADQYINHYKNLFGKKLIVVVYSQTGSPIGLFQGDKCYTEVPNNLPKTTLINVDGKLVYVHRANIDILPATMFE